jgi:hypothetical protein
VRLPWVIENDAGDLDRMKAITDAGEMLVRALDLGRCRPESLGYRAALMWSENAMDQLTALEWSPEYGALVHLASQRVRGTKPRADDKRDLKRKATAARG